MALLPVAGHVGTSPACMDGGAFLIGTAGVVRRAFFFTVRKDSEGRSEDIAKMLRYVVACSFSAAAILGVGVTGG